MILSFTPSFSSGIPSQVNHCDRKYSLHFWINPAASESPIAFCCLYIQLYTYPMIGKSQPPAISHYPAAHRLSAPSLEANPGDFR